MNGPFDHPDPDLDMAYRFGYAVGRYLPKDIDMFALLPCPAFLSTIPKGWNTNMRRLAAYGALDAIEGRTPNASHDGGPGVVHFNLASVRRAFQKQEGPE